MSNSSDNDNKTRRLDDDYFKKIASRATSAPSGSDDDKTRIVGQATEVSTAKPESDKTQIYRPNAKSTKSNLN